MSIVHFVFRFVSTVTTKGKSFDFERDYSLYRKYYYDYLPEAIKPFFPIIESRQIGNYYFGGGTASLMKPETMPFVFNIFLGFKEVRSKTFEIHSSVWTEEQDANTILRKPYVIVGLEISWKERTIAVDEFLGRLKNLFQHTIEYPSSIIIEERRLGLAVC